MLDELCKIGNPWETKKMLNAFKKMPDLVDSAKKYGVAHPELVPKANFKEPHEGYLERAGKLLVDYYEWPEQAKYLLGGLDIYGRMPGSRFYKELRDSDYELP